MSRRPITRFHAEETVSHSKVFHKDAPLSHVLALVACPLSHHREQTLPLHQGDISSCAHKERSLVLPPHILNSHLDQPSCMIYHPPQGWCSNSFSIHLWFFQFLCGHQLCHVTFPGRCKHLFTLDKVFHPMTDEKHYFTQVYFSEQVSLLGSIRNTSISKASTSLQSCYYC